MLHVYKTLLNIIFVFLFFSQKSYISYTTLLVERFLPTSKLHPSYTTIHIESDFQNVSRETITYTKKGGSTVQSRLFKWLDSHRELSAFVTNRLSCYNNILFSVTFQYFCYLF